MVGTNTAMNDNPMLNARYYAGNNPIRILIDKDLKVAATNFIFNSEAQTVVFNKIKNGVEKNIEFIKLDGDDSNFLNKILEILCKKNIISVIIEGGQKLLDSFIKNNLWDEARIIISQNKIREGLHAPILKAIHKEKYTCGIDSIKIYYNS